MSLFWNEPSDESDRQITMFMDQQRMLACGVSPADVVKAINARSAIMPVGDIKIGDPDYYVSSNSLAELSRGSTTCPSRW